MSDAVNILQALPSLQARQETVAAPELGGHVIVRGLLASEAFALIGLRSAAVRRQRDAHADHLALVRDRRAAWQERCDALPAGQPRPEFTPPEFTSPELDADELQQYATASSWLLHKAVVNSAGLSLATPDQWEVMVQHHPELVGRLTLVAERLSGLRAEDVEKNSPASLS